MRNIGAITGKCVAVEELEGSDTWRVYYIEPAIRGKYSRAVKVLSHNVLKLDYYYRIFGVFDTVKHKGIISPVLRALVPINTLELKYEPIVTKATNDIERIKSASCFILDSLTVHSVVEVPKAYIVEFSRTESILESKELNNIHFFAITSHHTKEQAASLTVGQEVSILGTLHTDSRTYQSSRKVELGTVLFAINPSEAEINSIISSDLFSLHPQNKRLIEGQAN